MQFRPRRWLAHGRMLTSFGNNQAISSQDHSVAWDRRYKPSVGARGIIGAWGIGSGATAYYDAEPALIQALTGAGRPVASFAHLALWGNATAQGRITSLRTYGQSNWGFSSGTVDLIGRSAGAAAVLNWAKANPTLVRRIVLLIPSVDLQDMVANDRGGYASSITAAWGGTPADANNPASNAASFTGIPILICYSTDDPINVPAVVQPFGAAVGARMMSLGPVGHATTGLDTAAVVDFLAGP